MTVLLEDVDDIMATTFHDAGCRDYVVSRDLLYADDTLLADTNSAVLQRMTETVATVGAEYGLELHWGKTVLLRVRCAGVLLDPAGNEVTAKESAVYLGGLLSADGDPRAEVSKRMGAAWAGFLALERIWRHANITKRRKHDIYIACIVPKLMYGLETLWLRKAENRRLDSFQIRCLRRVYGIPHSYISRVTNEEVMHTANHPPSLSNLLLRRQLALYGRIARMPDRCVQRQLVFEQTTLKLKQWAGRKGRGRPRMNWTTEVHRHAVRAAGSMEELAHAVCSTSRWMDVTTTYCKTVVPAEEEPDSE